MWTEGRLKPQPRKRLWRNCPSPSNGAKLFPLPRPFHYGSRAPGGSVWWPHVERLQGSYRSVPEQDRYRKWDSSERTGATKKINIWTKSCIFLIWIWLGWHNVHAMRWLSHPSHKKRCYNQKCINKSEDAANTASKRSDTDLGPALRKELARTVCKEKLSSSRRERREAMWRRFGLSCFAAGGVGNGETDEETS